MKFKAKTKDCHLIVRAKTARGEIIDEQALDAFSRAYLRGFMKPKLLKKNLLEYTGPVGIPLIERLKKPVSKRDFLFIMEQIVVAVQKVCGNSLQINRMVLDLNYVYINEITKEIQFLYVPTVGELPNPGVVGFIETIVYSTIPAAEQDMDFVSRFIYFLRAQRVFNPVQVEKYIAKEDSNVVNTIKKQNLGQSGFMTSKQKHYYEHYDQDGMGGDEATGLLDEGAAGMWGEDEATGLLDEGAAGMWGEEEATGLLYEEEATSLLYEEDDSGTALLDEDFPVHYPSLLRSVTQETIEINKPVFRLGKDPNNADYCVSDNKAVSRSHADLINRNGTCFIMDLNSKNHTYVNGQMLPSQCEIEIQDGDVLRLGNEEFIFYA